MGKLLNDIQSPLSVDRSIWTTAIFGKYGSMILCDETQNPIYCNMIYFFKVITSICLLLLILRVIHNLTSKNMKKGK
jgi:hypothetical protein